jgi:acyl carrier protein
MQIEDQIKQFILTKLYFAENQSLKEDDSFLETGIVDSTGVMELVGFVQTQFGVTVEMREIVVDNFDSVSKVARYIRNKLAPPERRKSPSSLTTPRAPATIAGR